MNHVLKSEAIWILKIPAEITIKSDSNKILTIIPQRHVFIKPLTQTNWVTPSKTICENFFK
jgi:hypothetical protein